MEIEEGRHIDASVKKECILEISDKGSFSSFLISHLVLIMFPCISSW